MSATQLRTRILSFVASVSVGAGFLTVLGAQSPVTSPRAALGFDLGDDYQVANYTQLSTYWRKLDQESDRVSVVEYGKSSDGRPMLMAIVTSPANHQNLGRYREISRRLALAENLTDEQARQLAAEGKAVVWIDAGLHATEIANTQALTELLYRMASRNDAETRRILDDVVLLAAFSNPDGLELVADWYMREQEPARRTMSGLPVLYQKYIGHDNNRESLLMNMPESESIGRVLYREWFPQIMYNQHQSGPAGTVLFIGQMRDPSNPFLDPLMAPSMELVSAAIHTRLVAEGKPGATNRTFASYQNWWNGGVRSTACFHNQIGILSEISGSPTPVEIAFVPKNMVASNDNPFPVQPQTWHLRQTVEYLITASRAILDIASEHRDDFLFNIYRMGKNGIDKGNRDTWTNTAKGVAAVEAAMERDKASSGRGGAPAKYYQLLRDPARRDPRGYIIPSDQPDFLTATKFVNALLKNGVAVHRATAPFVVEGRRYPAGSLVVKTAQAFRPHVLDNFEPQDYPDDFAYPGGPPVRPYDVTGYTLAFQMGVQFDRMLEPFDGPFERIEDTVTPVPGLVSGARRPVGYILGHQANDAFVAINRLLGQGESVYWLRTPMQVGGNNFRVGSIYIPSKPTTAAAVTKLAVEHGLDFAALTAPPQGDALRLKPLRIGVVDVYGGSMPSGWLQWLFTQFGFPFEVVYPPQLDAGGLNGRFDVLVFEDGIVPAGGGDGRGPAIDPAAVPAEYRTRIGTITEARTLPHLRQFLNGGGTIVAVGTSTSLASRLGLPIANALVEPGGMRLPPEKFYAPGCILRVRVDTSQPVAYGLPERLDIFYSNNPLFRFQPGPGLRAIAWFDAENPLRSGWVWGASYLKQAIAVAEADVGKGRLVVSGPLVAFRAHPHGTFKLLFNAVYAGSAQPVTLPVPKRSER
ncbi:MAG: M14 family zinc carboxypeptidase [Bacteroidales bacterium]